MKDVNSVLLKFQFTRAEYQVFENITISQGIFVLKFTVKKLIGYALSLFANEQGRTQSVGKCVLPVLLKSHAFYIQTR